MITLGSRGSDLALAQSKRVASDLERATGETVRIEILSTRGDRILDKPLPQVGGKGLFTEELEQALREGRIDFAVHSLKDLPVEDPGGLCLGAVPPRESASDVLVFDPAFHDEEAGTLPLPDGSVVGTSSPRRAAAIGALRPGLEIRDLRGNVPTRVGRVREGRYHGILLARAGLNRLSPRPGGPDLGVLDLDGLVAIDLPTNRFVPAPGQGALGIQCRADDRRMLELLASIHDEETARCTSAERGLLLALGGGCSMPFGALAEPIGDGRYSLRAGLSQRHGSPASLVQFQVEGTDLEALTAELLERLRPLADEPLKGRSITLVRPGGSDSSLRSHLSVAGATVHGAALTETLPVAPESTELSDLSTAIDLVVTSARAVDRLFEELAALGSTWRPERAFAVGPATRAALSDRGVEAEIPDEPGGGAALADFSTIRLAARDRRPLLFPCALERHGALERGLIDAGFEVRPVPLYRVEVLSGSEWPTEECSAVLWTSPSSVDAAELATGSRSPRTTLHVALGDSTAGALEAKGLGPIRIAASPHPRDVLRALQDETRHA